MSNIYLLGIEKTSPIRYERSKKMDWITEKYIKTDIINGEKYNKYILFNGNEETPLIKYKKLEVKNV